MWNHVAKALWTWWGYAAVREPGMSLLDQQERHNPKPTSSDVTYPILPLLPVLENWGVKACFGSIWHATMSLMWLRSYPCGIHGRRRCGEGRLKGEEHQVHCRTVTFGFQKFWKNRFVAFATTRCCSMCVASLHPQRRGARRRPSWVSSRSTFNGNFKLRHLATAAVPGFRDGTWRDSYAEPFWEGVSICTRLCSRPWHLYNSIFCILFWI